MLTDWIHCIELYVVLENLVFVYSHILERIRSNTFLLVQCGSALWDDLRQLYLCNILVFLTVFTVQYCDLT